jgi:hypothetical protein
VTKSIRYNFRGRYVSVAANGLFQRITVAFTSHNQVKVVANTKLSLTLS